jgi:hypothetical protein
MEIQDIDKLIEENNAKKLEVDAENKALLKIKKRFEKEAEKTNQQA